MSEEVPESAVAGPTTGQERIVCIDSLRGVAVLGILVMNVYGFAMPFMAYSDPLLMGGTDPLNMGIWFLTHIFFDQKFMTIFSLLFGAGLVMMSGRAEAKGEKFGRIFFRRQSWLLLIGMLHAYLIWFGDILFVYAWVGMLAYFFRNRGPRFLIMLACLCLPVSLLADYGYSGQIEKLQSRALEIIQVQEQGGELDDEDKRILKNWDRTKDFVSHSDENLQENLTAYRGGYLENLARRVPTAALMQGASFYDYGLWRVGALMLLGMALMKLGVLSGQRTAAFYRRLMLYGYAFGLPMATFSGVNSYMHQFDPLYMLRVGGVPNYFGSILVAFGHIGLVMFIAKTGAMQRIMARFAAVGRMAISNYLMHSIVLTTVFYGYGLGLYGEIPRTGQMGFVAAIIGLQLQISPWWLDRYRFGPVEWLWRSLTYSQRQPMRGQDRF
jgi:uncharacterized protein